MKQIKNAFVSVFINNKYINISPRESRSLPVFKTIKILILRLVLSLPLLRDISNTVHTSTIPNNSVVASRNITGRRLENIDCPVRANTTAIAEVNIETVIICLLFIRLSTPPPPPDCARESHLQFPPAPARQPHPRISSAHR